MISFDNASLTRPIHNPHTAHTTSTHSPKPIPDSVSDWRRRLRLVDSYANWPEGPLFLRLGFLVAAKISVTAERRFVEKLWTVVAAANHNNKFQYSTRGRGLPACLASSKQEASVLCSGWVGSSSSSSSSYLLLFFPLLSSLPPCIMMCNIWQKRSHSIRKLPIKPHALETKAETEAETETG